MLNAEGPLPAVYCDTSETGGCPSGGPMCCECFAVEIDDDTLATAIFVANEAVCNGERCDWRKLLTDLAKRGHAVLLTDELARMAYKALVPVDERPEYVRRHIPRPGGATVREVWPFVVRNCDTCQAPTYHAWRTLDSAHGWGACVMCGDQHTGPNNY